MFAIIDIETTGGQPSKDRITEIAIIRHDGREVVETFSTLINPYCNIPYNITRITGITNEMVKDAPGFHEVARKIIELTEDSVFVAHSVGFDYGFIKSAFHDLGYAFNRKTLCTVKLSRSVFQGLPSYSLGNLCNSLGIPLRDRHRALGDAEATAKLFGRILHHKPEILNGTTLDTEVKKLVLPPLLDQKVLDAIPKGITGVYYFHNQDGDVIYVGKSNDIRKRLLQHFTVKANESGKAEIMRNSVADISIENTGSELIALLLESDEIKRLKPVFNQAQKRVRQIPFYGIFSYTDEKGYVNLKAERLKPGDQPLTTADNLLTARKYLFQLIEQYNLCTAKCDLHHTGGACFEHQIRKCAGACVDLEPADDYNSRALEAIDKISFSRESFFLIDKGREPGQQAVVYIEQGIYRGFGYIDEAFTMREPGDLLSSIRPYHHNHDIQTILCRFKNAGLKKVTLGEVSEGSF